MELEIIRNGPKPLYKQIADYFREQIEKDILKHGDLLPNQRELANQLGVNRSTISTAYSELWSSGLIYSKQGRGTKVINPNHPYESSINWQYLHQKGKYQPSPFKAMSRKIEQAAQNPSNINLATGNFSLDSFGIMDTINFHNQNFNKGDFSISLNQLYNINVKPSNILLTGGHSQVLFLITSAFLKKDDVIAVERPSTFYDHQIFKELGVRMIPINLDGNGLIPEHFELITRQNKIKMLFTQPTFQEPTGTLLPLERRIQLLSICKTMRIPIVETVSKEPLYHIEGAPCSLYSLADDKSLVISVGVLTELLGEEYKMSWIHAPNHSYDRLSVRQQELGLDVSPLEVKIVGNLLKQGNIKNRLERLRHELILRKNRMSCLLNENNVEIHNPQGGTSIWCKVPTIRNEEVFLEKCIDNGVIIMPGSLYGADSSFIKLSFAIEDINHISLGISRLTNTINAQN